MLSLPDHVSLRRDLLIFAATTVLMLAASPRLMEAQSLRGDLYSVNGNVNAVAVSGNILYVAGSFSQVGPVTGGMALVDEATGQLVPSPPKVLGQALAVAPDGAGGWFLAGNFTHVAGVPRRGLARINADHTLSSWDPNPNSVVYTMVVSGNTVYVGGAFTAFGGGAITRNFIAAIDATTGIPTAWDPNANNAVQALAVSGSTVY